VYIYVQKEAEILYTKNKLREGKKFLRLWHFFTEACLGGKISSFCNFAEMTGLLLEY